MRTSNVPRVRVLWLACVLLLTALLTSSVGAHPEDEFCSADDGLDPALCAALAEMDRSTLDAGAAATPATTSSNDLLKRTTFEVAVLYVRLGIVHIVPRGLDHILFVLALFLSCTRWRPLLLQVSLFTLAHTLTLGLAAAGLVSLPGALIESLIALSIVFVAVENLLLPGFSRYRLLLVFGFGLFHGLGFASVLRDIGLPEGQFVPALLSFNVGVEVGQLSVIAVAWLIFQRFFRQPHYRKLVVLPGSALIALTGLWWSVQRLWPLLV